MPKHTARSILAQARGFMESCILLTAGELDLFTILSRKPATAAEVAASLGGDERAVRTLLDAVTALGYLQKSDGVYRCAEGISELLSADSEESVLPMVHHMMGGYRSWGRLTQKVRGASGDEDRPVGFDDPARLKAFIGGMHVVSRDRARQVAETVAPRDDERMLDVGGASGSYVMAFLERAPGMVATLFDRPPVVEMARQRLGDAGLLDRVTLAPGDFYVDELPGGHSLALVSAIIHQNSYEQNVELFDKVFRALEPGGRILVRDHVLDPDRTTPVAGAIFAINMLVNTEGGGCYTFDEIREGLEEAGFIDVRLLQRDQVMDGLVEARRPRA